MGSGEAQCLNGPRTSGPSLTAIVICIVESQYNFRSVQALLFCDCKGIKKNLRNLPKS